MTHARRPARRGAGQALVEYLLGVLVLVTLLTVPLIDGRSAAALLADALRERHAVLGVWVAVL